MTTFNELKESKDICSFKCDCYIKAIEKCEEIHRELLIQGAKARTKEVHEYYIKKQDVKDAISECDVEGNIITKEFEQELFGKEVKL